ncbi:hypothetical protein [Paraglaciecola aestuariivivens]
MSKKEFILMLKPLPNLESLGMTFAKVDNEKIIEVPLKELRIEEASYCVLYYWHRNRAAWNSTKVSHFYHGSVQTTLSDVKNVVESHRANGNVFFIHTQPTLKLTLESNIQVLITEINTNCPLVGFRLKYSKGPNNSFNIKKGTRLLEFYESLKAQNKLPSSSTSALLFLKRNSHSPDQIKSIRYQSLKSYSKGSGYFLSWTLTKNKKSNSSVMRLVK